MGKKEIQTPNGEQMNKFMHEIYKCWYYNNNNNENDSKMKIKMVMKVIYVSEELFVD